EQEDPVRHLITSLTDWWAAETASPAPPESAGEAGGALTRRGESWGDVSLRMPAVHRIRGDTGRLPRRRGAGRPARAPLDASVLAPVDPRLQSIRHLRKRGST